MQRLGKAGRIVFLHRGSGPTFTNNVFLQQNLACYSNRLPGFFLEGLRQISSRSWTKNKEMKENLKKFRQEAQKLEESDALKAARQKFNTVENPGRASEVVDEVSKTDFAKKAGKIGEDLGKTAKGMGETIAERGQKLGETGAFRGISEATKAVKQEIDSQGISARVYRAPERLRKRVEVSMEDAARVFEANTEALGVELHKDSKFYQSWENFKNNNQYVNKVLSWKMQYDESENPMIRASRLLTDKVSDVMGNLFSKTELSETLTEICKIDPSFDQKQFLRDCENDIIPNILEAMIRGDLEILKDWCFESTYNIIATPIAQAQKAGFFLDSKILDIENVDLAMGKVSGAGPGADRDVPDSRSCACGTVKRPLVEGDPRR
ncbi:hypothetical protein quinque_014866 [Culex quinquefasciatus]